MNDGYPSSPQLSAGEILRRLTASATLAAGALLYGAGSATLSTLALGTAGSLLVAGASAPAWSDAGLSYASGVLAIAGSAPGTPSAGQVLIGGGTIKAGGAIACTALTASAATGAVQIGTQPQAGENVGIWSSTANAGAVAGRAAQFWNTYSGSYASTAIDCRAYIDGSSAQDHVLGGQFAAYANSGYTGTITEFNVLAASAQWNASSGTATEANELKLFGFSGTNPGNIAARWGISQMSANSHNRFYGQMNAFASCYLGSNDGSSVIGLARYSSSDKFGYFNFGIYAGGAGVAQADTGGRFCVRTPANTQLIALSLAAVDGAATFASTVTVGGKITTVSAVPGSFDTSSVANLEAAIRTWLAAQFT